MTAGPPGDAREAGVILSAAGVILSEAGVILSEAKNLMYSGR